MLANLMKVAGVDHVITIDLHASQMQGFFKCPVDNLRAEPLIAKWIRMNIPDSDQCVVVSKNPGGTKRVTSLADALNVSFGIVTTDQRRPHAAAMGSMMNSTVFEAMGTDGTNELEALEEEVEVAEAFTTPERATREQDFATGQSRVNGETQPRRPSRTRAVTTMSMPVRSRLLNGTDTPSSPLANSTRAESLDGESGRDSPPLQLRRTPTAPGIAQIHHDDDGYEESGGDDDEDEVCKPDIPLPLPQTLTSSTERPRRHHRPPDPRPHRR